MGFQQYLMQTAASRLKWSNVAGVGQRLHHSVRCFSVIGKDTESHILPRLYVGPRLESPVPLSHYLSERTANMNGVNHQERSINVLSQGTVLPLSEDQCRYVTEVMRMIGPGSKKGRWSFRSQAPCIRVFDGQEEWVAHLESMGEIPGDDPAKKRRRRQDMMVMARCIAALRRQGPALHSNGPTSAATTTVAPMTTLYPILCFAPPKKKERYQWILEKCTELGMDAWMLLDTDRAEASTSRDYERKGLAYVLEAAEQCETLQIPQLLSLPTATHENLSTEEHHSDSTLSFIKLRDLLDFMSQGEAANRGNDHINISILVCRERSPGSTPIIQALQQIQSQGASIKQQQQGPSSHFCLVLVGPEGGWSPEESQTFDRLCHEQNGRVWNVSLGSNILRTDTAAAAAVAAFALHKDQYNR